MKQEITKLPFNQFMDHSKLYQANHVIAFAKNGDMHIWKSRSMLASPTNRQNVDVDTALIIAHFNTSTGNRIEELYPERRILSETT